MHFILLLVCYKVSHNPRSLLFIQPYFGAFVHPFQNKYILTKAWHVFKSQEARLPSANHAKEREDRKEAVAYHIICQSNRRHRCGDTREPGANEQLKRITSVVCSPVGNWSQNWVGDSQGHQPGDCVCLWKDQRGWDRSWTKIRGTISRALYGHLLSCDHMKGQVLAFIIPPLSMLAIKKKKPWLM